MDCKYKTKEEYNEFMEQVESAVDCSADVAGKVDKVTTATSPQEGTGV